MGFSKETYTQVTRSLETNREDTVCCLVTDIEKKHIEIAANAILTPEEAKELGHALVAALKDLGEKYEFKKVPEKLYRDPNEYL